MTDRTALIAHARLVALTEGVFGHRGTMQVIRELCEELEQATALTDSETP